MDDVIDLVGGGSGREGGGEGRVSSTALRKYSGDYRFRWYS